MASSVGREGCVGQEVDNTCDGLVEAGSAKLKGLFLTNDPQAGQSRSMRVCVFRVFSAIPGVSKK